MTRLVKDVIVLPEDGGRWVAMNVFSKTCLGLDGEGLAVLGAAGAGGEPDPDRIVLAWDIGWFSNFEGLMADPSRYVRDPARWPEPRRLPLPEFLALCRERFLLVDDEAAYRARFAPKTSMLDGERFGNFHQQLGRELFVKRRALPERWWLGQKFTEDLTDIRADNLYGGVNKSRLADYVSRRMRPGQSVVDIGCGSGFFTNLMARAGASTLGVDPSQAYIDIARRLYGGGEGAARFEVMAVGQPGGLDAVPTDSADVVFMSDALLFYFVPLGEAPDISVLLSDVRRILKPGGLFVSVEPHYAFWLQPWLGEPDRPFTVMTEYLEKSFGVTASASRLVQAFARGGFAVTWLEEFTPEPAFERVDPRAYHFARQFPLWQLYELRDLGERPDGGG